MVRGMKVFGEFLTREDIVLFDGAMGTQLNELGLPMSGEVNLTHPEQVMKVHEAYLKGGAQILITNTLTMNRPFIEAHDLGLDVREVNLAGAKLANAAGDNHFVVGDISSTGILLEPFGELTSDKAFEGFREQAQALAEGGVDGFIVETMYDLKESLLAVRACREVSDLLIIATIAFNSTKNGGRTIMGDSAAGCAQQLESAGASVVGANCGDISPEQMADVIAAMRLATDLPLLAQPNAGSPKLVDGKTVFGMDPEQFAAGIQKCIKAGANLVGGCCGTTPEHISLLSASLTN
ncbi:Bifunctional homocysteine S-methyltransferase/5,10-methylenetetrahydrofolate reductase [subsurface metagenome]